MAIPSSPRGVTGVTGRRFSGAEQREAVERIQVPCVMVPVQHESSRRCTCLRGAPQPPFALPLVPHSPITSPRGPPKQREPKSDVRQTRHLCVQPSQLGAPRRGACCSRAPVPGV